MPLLSVLVLIGTLPTDWGPLGDCALTRRYAVTLGSEVAGLPYPYCLDHTVRGLEPEVEGTLVWGGAARNEGRTSLTLGELQALSISIAPRTGSERYTYEPLEWREDTWYGSSYWSGPDWTRVGKDWQHSGTEVSSCRAFVAPRAGRVTVTGRVRKADTNGGDGIHAAIRLGERTLFEVDLDAKDDTGATHDTEVELAEGDCLRFVLHRRGEITCDTTWWDPVITYDDGEAFRASEGFGREPGVWRCELERDSGDATSSPEIHAPDTRFVWRGHGLAAGTTLALATPLAPGRGTTLPCWIYSDGGRGGSLAIVPLSPALWTLRAHRSGDGAVRLVAVAEPPLGPITLTHGAELPLPSLLVCAVDGDWQAARERVWGARPTLPFEAPRDALGLLGLRGYDEDAWCDLAPTGLKVTGDGGPVRAEWNPAMASSGWLVSVAGRPVAATTRAHWTAVGEGVRDFTRIGVSGTRGWTVAPPVEAWEPGAIPHAVAGDLASLVEADWEALAGGTATRRAETEAALERAKRVIERLPEEARRDLDFARGRLAVRLTELGPLGDAGEREHYLAARWLLRECLLADPALGSEEVLFTKRVPSEYSHLVMQYFGWRSRPGGGIYALERPGRSLATRTVFEPEDGAGSVLGPSLSFDATRLAFSFASSDPADRYFHLWEVGSDGSGARQLSEGPFEDLTPTWLPGGDLMLVSTRRKGHARCFGSQFGPDWHVYTLHRYERATGEVRTLSWHETNEWFPTVLHDGSVAYARWDYVDRHAVLHQNLWRTNPDGTDAAVLYGNHTEDPHCCFEAQPVPGSGKVIATASAHHSITGGSLVLIDGDRGYDGPIPIERLTPEVVFPEAEGIPSTWYASPWPLSEDLYLCAWSPTPLVMEPAPNEPNGLGIYLLDRLGNRELLYRDPAIGCSNPIPLRARPAPPERPSLPHGEGGGVFVLQDVTRGMGGVAPGVVKALRIVQILPKTTPVADDPPVGLAGQEPARAVLGTVPVAADGSACFEAPSRVPLLFQALDERGEAIQTMRSAAYLQPGERISCVGCHEPRNSAPGPSLPLAALSPPARIAPEPDGAQPFSYPRLVQPVLDARCIGCHGDAEPAGGLPLTATASGVWSRSYLSLTGGAAFWQGATNPENAREALVPRYGGWNPVHRTEPGGAYGAKGSRLLRMLDEGHQGVALEPEERRRIALWLDVNAVFYGTYDRTDQARQLAGEVVAMPSIQ